MPSRIIKETIIISESLTAISAEAERFFWRLVVKADDFGLYYGDPRILASLCFPQKPPSEQKIRSWLNELVREDMVGTYTAPEDGKKYLKLLNWGKCQQTRAKSSKFKASEQYANMIQAEAYYRNRTDVQRKTNDVANRSNTRIEHPILKKLVDQKANYLLGKPFTVDTKNSSYGDALNDIFDQTFRRKIKSLGKGAVKSGIAWLQPYFDDGKLAFMRIPSAELVPIWRDAERTKLDAFIRFYDQVIYIGTRKHTITHAELWWTGGVKYFKTDAFAGTIAGDFIVDTEHGDEANDYTEPLADVRDRRRSPRRGEVHLYPEELRRPGLGRVHQGPEGTHGDQSHHRRRCGQTSGRP